MDTFNYLLQMIYKAYDGLSSREKLVADSLIENPSQIILNTASQLAKSVGVSNSTVTRFIQRIGYESFDLACEEARTKLREGSPLTRLDAEPSVAAETLSETGQFLETEISLLKATYATLPQQELEDISRHLVKAPTLSFLGFRNSHFFAAYAHWQFIQFHPNVRLLAREGETLAEKIAHLKEGDIVVAVGVRRLVKDFEHYLRVINDTGADVLLITDPSSQKMASLAKWTLVCPVANSHAFDSYTGILSLIRLLAFKAFVKSGEAGKNHIRRIEEHHEKLLDLN